MPSVRFQVEIRRLTMSSLRNSIYENCGLTSETKHKNSVSFDVRIAAVFDSIAKHLWQWLADVCLCFATKSQNSMCSARLQNNVFRGADAQRVRLRRTFILVCCRKQKQGTKRSTLLTAHTTILHKILQCSQT
jgi:hypothetical protein